MRLTAALSGDLRKLLAEEVRAAESAVAAGVRQAGDGLKGELRRQVTGAGLGGRLANAWRERHYPNQKVDAASGVIDHVSIRRGEELPQAARAIFNVMA